jgi:hypothetical protein
MSSISVVVLSVQRDRGSVARAPFAHAPTAKISARPPLPVSPPLAERGLPVRPRRHGLQPGTQIPSISRRSTGLRNGSARRPAIGSAADRYRQMYENHFERQGRQIETGDAICGAVTTTLRCTERTGAPQCSGSGTTRSFAEVTRSTSDPAPILCITRPRCAFHGNLAEAELETHLLVGFACYDQRYDLLLAPAEQRSDR